MSESPKHQNFLRRILQWKAVVVFNPALGWDVLHTQTEELSPTGAAIITDYGNLTGATITLILDLPSGVEGQTTVLRVPARVTSSERIAQADRYRHDLKFVRTPNDRLGILDKYFSDLPQPPLSHLDKLKVLAQQKLAEEKARQKQTEEKHAQGVADAAPQSQDQATDILIDNALRQAHEYFNELVEQLNVVKPAFHRQYAVAGIPEFGLMSWGGGRADYFHVRDASSKQKRLERVCLNFTLSGGEPIQLSREYPASDKLKRWLSDSKIDFTARDVYNARGSLEIVKFEVPRVVEASVQLTAKYDLGKIQLNTIHIAGFGAMQRLVAPQAMSEAALNEFSAFILGEIKDLKLLRA